MTTPTKPIMKQIAIRLPVSVLARLKNHVARLDRERPGVSHTQADALRTALLVGLAQVEAADDQLN